MPHNNADKYCTQYRIWNILNILWKIGLCLINWNLTKSANCPKSFCKITLGHRIVSKNVGNSNVHSSTSVTFLNYWNSIVGMPPLKRPTGFISPMSQLIGKNMYVIEMTASYRNELWLLTRQLRVAKEMYTSAQRPSDDDVWTGENGRLRPKY